MGKYIKKSKVTTTTAEVQSPSSGGVRTRAKTLALQRQQQLNDDVSSSYLQLRSRRLEKPPQPKPSGHMEKNFRKSDGGCFGKIRKNSDDGDDVDVSEFAESNNNNNLDFEGRDRSTRESTPCSLIRDSESTRTPGSTTRTRTPSSAAARRALPRFIPHEEFEEFFAYEDQRQEEQRRLLMEKYNFDFVNDAPCPGRYEWQQANP